jgi:hypothetical protein
MKEQDYEIRLRNAEGIPIVNIAGLVTKSALRAVKTTLDQLASAGHYNIVINIERAHLANMRFLNGLAGAVRNIRSHYGVVHLILSADAQKQLPVISKVTGLFRLCASEGQAILRIKRLGRQPEAISQSSARILEKS